MAGKVRISHELRVIVVQMNTAGRIQRLDYRWNG